MSQDPLPERQEEMEGGPVPDELEPPPSRSLADDLAALFDDGKTYVQAEVNFQKSRVKYVRGTLGRGIGFVLAVVILVHLALLGLVVGLLLALVPLVGIWAAIAIVVGVLIAGSFVFALKARKQFKALSAAFSETKK